MAEEPLIGQQLVDSRPEYLRPLTDREARFALHLAVGESIPQAARHVGIGRSTGYEWEAREDVRLAVQRMSLEAATRARRRLASMVNQAVRKVGRLVQDSSHKGAPTELEACRLVINAARLEDLPQTSGDRRIFTYVPRPGLAEEPTAPDHDLQPLAQQAQTALPRVATPDGLPPDLPRTEEERQAHPRNAGYARPLQDPTLDTLKDPENWLK